MSKKHALLSASGAARWLECTPSARLEEQLPQKPSSYADEGTAAHDLCEIAARYALGMIDDAAYNAAVQNFEKNQYYSAEMLECAIDYGAFIKDSVDAAIAECPDAFAELEVKSLDFSEWVPAGFGTGDCIIVADDQLEVIDFKYGKGVLVEARNNPQMRLYALGAIKRYGALYDIKRVRTTIIQPRISREPSREEMSIDELLDWAETFVKPRAALAYAGKGEFNPGEYTCKFCRAKEQCKARVDKNLALFDESPDVLLMTPDEAGELLMKAADIKAWLKDLETLVTRTLFEGTAVEGWKLVEGRSNRKLGDEAKIVEAMVEAGYDDAELYTRTLISLTAMEKAYGKKEINRVLGGLITKPPGKPTLAPISDKREAFSPEGAILDALDEEDEE